MDGGVYICIYFICVSVHYQCLLTVFRIIVSIVSSFRFE